MGWWRGRSQDWIVGISFIMGAFLSGSIGRQCARFAGGNFKLLQKKRLGRGKEEERQK